MVLLTKIVHPIVHYWHVDNVPRFLLSKTNNTKSCIIGYEVLLAQFAIIAVSLATEVAKKEYVAYLFFHTLQFHIVHSIYLLICQVDFSPSLFLLDSPLLPHLQRNGIRVVPFFCCKVAEFAKAGHVFINGIGHHPLFLQEQRKPVSEGFCDFTEGDLRGAVFIKTLSKVLPDLYAAIRILGIIAVPDCAIANAIEEIYIERLDIFKTFIVNLYIGGEYRHICIDYIGQSFFECRFVLFRIQLVIRIELIDGQEHLALQIEHSHTFLR